MQIALTYDLRKEYLDDGYSPEETAEFDKEEAIDGIESAIKSHGHTVTRIGSIKKLVSRLALGERWGMVFNICEGMFGIGREAQVPGLLDAYQIPYTFSDPMVLSLTLNKAMTKRIVRDSGVPTADFAVVAAPGDISRCTLPFPLFVKPIGEGTSKGIDERSTVTTPRELAETCERLLAAFGQPVIIERFLPGREFTVGIIGTGEHAWVPGVMEIDFSSSHEKKAYSYHNKQNYETIVSYHIVKDALSTRCAQIALDAWRCLGCRDAGRVDLRCDEVGEPCFIEVNPIPGLNPIHSDLPILCRKVALDYNTLIGEILKSAQQRVKV
jgi:D-alanine-D-alanine ligase